MSFFYSFQFLKKRIKQFISPFFPFLCVLIGYASLEGIFRLTELYTSYMGQAVTVMDMSVADILRDDKQRLTGIFFTFAYRLSDESVRIPYLRDENNDVQLQVYLENKWKNVTSKCIGDSCQVVSHCSWVPYSFDVSVPPNDQYLKIRSWNWKRKSVSLMIIDSRPKRKIAKSLTVCVAPLEFVTDWQEMVRFIEIWKLQGATKIKLYAHSLSKYTSFVLDHFRKGSDPKVEVIGWGNMPEIPQRAISPGERTQFVNMMALNDCLYRSRSESLYVVAPNPQQTVVHPIEDLASVVHRIFQNNFHLSSYCVDSLYQDTRKSRAPSNVKGGRGIEPLGEDFCFHDPRKIDYMELFRDVITNSEKFEKRRETGIAASNADRTSSLFRRASPEMRKISQVLSSASDFFIRSMEKEFDPNDWKKSSLEVKNSLKYCKTVNDPADSPSLKSKLSEYDHTPHYRHCNVRSCESMISLSTESEFLHFTGPWKLLDV